LSHSVLCSIGDVIPSVTCDIPVITIPATIQLIFRSAFFGCVDVTEVNVAANSELQQFYGFDECTSLKKVILPPSVEVIDAFFGCTLLTTVYIPPECALRKICGFGRCKALTRIDVPASVEMIGSCDKGYCTFSRCERLQEVIFARYSRLTELCAFDHCLALRDISIPASVRRMRAFNFSADDVETSRCGPQQITFVGESQLREILGFGRCTRLERLELPERVERVVGFNMVKSYGSSGRRSISSACLSEIRFGTGRRLLEIDGFNGCTQIKRVIIPSSIQKVCGFGVSDHSDVSNSCQSLTEVIFAAISHLQELRGFEHSSIERLLVPASVQIIGKHVVDRKWEYRSFSGCQSLSEVVFAQGSAVQEVDAFDGCPQLKQITIPASVRRLSGFNVSTVIVDEELVQTPRLTHVVLSSDSGLEEIHFATGSELRELDGFNGCSHLAKLEIPESVEVIAGFGRVVADGAVRCCSSLCYVVFAPHKRDQGLRRMRRSAAGCSRDCREDRGPRQLQLPEGIDLRS
jgi:hypothetical protein